MRKINLIDVLIILILLFSAYSFIDKESEVYQQVDEYYYTGSQIYKAINSMEYLDSKGFQYETWIRGYWWSDYLTFEETGYVIGTGEGSFTFLRQNGETVEIGGRMSYEEEVGASEIKLIIKTKSTVNYRMYSGTKDSFDDLLAYVSDAASFLDQFQIDSITVSGSISFDQSIEPSRVFDEGIEYELRKGLYYVKGIEFTSYENGVTIDLDQADVSELEKLEGLLAENGIIMDEVFFSDLNIFVRTGLEIGELDKYWIKEHIAQELSSVIDPDEDSIHIRL
ncbi:MAG TPA: hypothetical protein PK718_04385 [Candidatus Methanofastidiosa archaeon]|nr:hypothetical protein [Candidatus Methanofastidiosa archaeon]HPR41769.1 hypothetical protein [Candidatus Methanofastidiosa archaeon]